MDFKIAVIKGDGIGPDIVDQALLVLDKIGSKYNHSFNYTELLAGGAALDAYNIPLPEETIRVCKESDAVFLGAVGGDKWDNLPADIRPEKALLGLRGELELFANIRPAIMYQELSDACPLKANVMGNEGLDLVVIRELTGGIYFGERGIKDTKYGKSAYDTMIYSEHEVRRIAKVAFDIARKRKKKVTSVDKANILDSSRLWRKVVEEVAKEYPDIKLNHLYVDNCAMQLVINPKQFDVILTENMFGDILSDEASMITGSIGMLPSASLGNSKQGMYEPIHGSAPDIAGQDKANPIATILSAAMMLRYSFDLEEEALAVEAAVEKVLKKGYRTMDLYSEGTKLVGTKEIGKLICDEI